MGLEGVIRSLKRKIRRDGFRMSVKKDIKTKRRVSMWPSLLYTLVND